MAGRLKSTTHQTFPCLPKEPGVIAELEWFHWKLFAFTTFETKHKVEH